MQAGNFRRTEGGNSGKDGRESPEGLRSSQEDPWNDKDLAYNLKREMVRRGADWRMGSTSEEAKGA